MRHAMKCGPCSRQVSIFVKEKMRGILADAQRLVGHLILQLPFERLVENGGEHGVQFARGFVLKANNVCYSTH